MTWVTRSYPHLRTLLTPARCPVPFQRLSGLWFQRATLISVGSLNRDLIDFINQPLHDISNLKWTRVWIHMKDGKVVRTRLFYADKGHSKGNQSELDHDHLDNEDDHLQARSPADSSLPTPSRSSEGAPASLPESTRKHQDFEGLEAESEETIDSSLAESSELSDTDTESVSKKAEKEHAPTLIPFPPGTRGCLYYRGHRQYPLIAGCIRFRVFPEGVTSFDGGYDLKMPNGRPWTRVVSRMGESNPGLMAKLLEEKLILKDWEKYRRKIILQDRRDPPKTYVLKKPVQNTPTTVGRRMNPIYKWDDVFLLDVQLTTAFFTYIKGTKEHPFHIQYLFRDRRRESRRKYGGSGGAPYEGVVAARFELSDAPEHQGENRHAVIRVVRIVKPINVVIPGYDGFVNMPAEGQLISRGLGNQSAPLSFPLNGKKEYHMCLRELFSSWTPPQEEELSEFDEMIDRLARTGE